MGSVETKLFQYGEAEMDYLIKVDGLLGEAITRIGKVERIIIPDPFTALVHAIVGQLISVKAVHTIWQRMQERFGAITPDNMIRYTADDIQRCGMSMKKAVYIANLSQMVARGDYQLNDLEHLPDQEVIDKLVAINGIGVWTAEMLLLGSFGRRDVLSWGDIGIRKGMMRLYGIDNLTKEQFQQYRRMYSPYGSIASIYLWAIAAEKD